MSQSNKKWYRSTGVIGLIITLSGFGLFTLGYWLIGEWILAR